MKERPRILDDPRVDKSGECWIWTGAHSVGGYGRIGNTYTHRIVYSQEVGPIEGVNVLHSCDNPPCLRPAHLFSGTQADNMADAHAKGRLDTSGLQRRGQWTKCARGHRFTKANTIIERSGARRCRRCTNEKQNARSARLRGAA